MGWLPSFEACCIGRLWLDDVVEVVEVVVLLIAVYEGLGAMPK